MRSHSPCSRGLTLVVDEWQTHGTLHVVESHEPVTRVQEAGKSWCGGAVGEGCTEQVGLECVLDEHIEFT